MAHSKVLNRPNNNPQFNLEQFLTRYTLRSRLIARNIFTKIQRQKQFTAGNYTLLVVLFSGVDFGGGGGGGADASPSGIRPPADP